MDISGHEGGERRFREVWLVAIELSESRSKFLDCGWDSLSRKITLSEEELFSTYSELKVWFTIFKLHYRKLEYKYSPLARDQSSRATKLETDIPVPQMSATIPLFSLCKQLSSQFYTLDLFPQWRFTIVLYLPVCIRETPRWSSLVRLVRGFARRELRRKKRVIQKTAHQIGDRTFISHNPPWKDSRLFIVGECCGEWGLAIDEGKKGPLDVKAPSGFLVNF
jgi:hypothetical protein